MNITDTQIKRRQKINEQKDKFRQRVEKLRLKLHKKISPLVQEEQQLLDTLRQVYVEYIEQEHVCSCCSLTYPDNYSLEDDGNFLVFYDADHPNDRREEVYNIDAFLNDYKKEK